MPLMLKSKKVLEREKEAESIVEFYCEDDIHNMSLLGFSPSQDFPPGCEENISNGELFLSMSGPESLTSLSEIKGK